MAKKSSLSKTAMWILMGLLFLGLGGFGAVNLTGNVRTIGSVGDMAVGADTYARQLQQELNAISRQRGSAMTFAQAQRLGLDRAVLQRLLRDRALDHEAQRIGLSIGDEVLSERIRSISAFQGIDGEFDRDAYAQTLQSANLNEAEFETDLRREAARQILQGAITSGVEMPAAYAQTLVDYVGETRDFTWVRFNETMLEEDIADPDSATLEAYFSENADEFTLPATKKITYVQLTPTDLVDTVELPEEELRAEYEARDARYNQPERRLVERLVFSDQDAVDQALAALDSGDTTYETLVQARGLSLQDIDQGDVARGDLGEAADAVFTANVGDIVEGPSDLGPALFRVNGVLPAQTVTFEDAEPELRDTLAMDRAIRQVEVLAEDYDDQLAGGATLEQMADQTDMTLGQIEWTADTSDGIAAYEAFREAANEVAEDDFAQIAQLEDGGIFALRLDESLPERDATFEQVSEEVLTAWRDEQITQSLVAQAEVAGDADAPLSDQGLDTRTVTGEDRSGFITGTPQGFMTEVFEMEIGETRVLPGSNSAVLVRLDAITPAERNAEAQDLISELRSQQNEALSRALFNIYADDTLARAGQNLDERAVNAVNVNFQ